MRRLDRSTLDHSSLPTAAKWEAKLRKALPDFDDFGVKAKAFEGQPLSSRRAGFPSYAPALLPTKNTKGGGTKAEWPPVWQRNRCIKKVLSALSLGKCAYCETDVRAGQHGQVEHFRPKALFPTRAYDLDNYLYSCELCNGTKSDKWPDTGSYLRPDDPGFDEWRLAFSQDGQVTAATLLDNEADETIVDFGLKRVGLVESRRTAIEARLRVVREFLDDTELSIMSKRTYVVRQMAKVEDPYSVAINQSIRAEWRARMATDL